MKDTKDLTLNEVSELTGNYDFRDYFAYGCDFFQCNNVECEDCLLSDVMKDCHLKRNEYKKRKK